jgi:putative oxidoreductase
MAHWFYPGFIAGWGAAALLLVRVVVGAALVLHGWPKIQKPTSWMNAMGMRRTAPGFLQALAALAEVGGGAALVLGLLTPLAAFGVVCQMLGALLLVHLPNGDPFVAHGKPTYELALVYLVVALLFIAVGPGRFSLDALLFAR